MPLPARITKEGLPSRRIKRRSGSPQHLSFIRRLPCTICWRLPPSIAHHLGGLDLGKGLGWKVHDRWTVPLCPACHDFLHSRDPQLLLYNGIDDRALAARLFAISGDLELGLRAVSRAQAVRSC